MTRALILAVSTLPDNVGYVAAAYLVFLALVLVYVAIMATKLGRVERSLQELNELAGNGGGGAGSECAADGEAKAQAEAAQAVREPVA